MHRLVCPDVPTFAAPLKTPFRRLRMLPNQNDRVHLKLQVLDKLPQQLVQKSCHGSSLTMLQMEMPCTPAVPEASWHEGATCIPEDVCSIHVEHDIWLVFLEGSMHLIQQPLVAANVGSRRLQAGRVNELDPYASDSTSDLPDSLGGGLKGIGGSSLILIQHAVDGGTLAHSSHAYHHDSAGKGQGLPWLRCLLGFCCADGCLKSIGAACIAVRLGDTDALC